MILPWLKAYGDYYGSNFFYGTAACLKVHPNAGVLAVGDRLRGCFCATLTKKALKANEKRDQKVTLRMDQTWPKGTLGHCRSKYLDIRFPYEIHSHTILELNFEIRLTMLCKSTARCTEGDRNPHEENAF